MLNNGIKQRLSEKLGFNAEEDYKLEKAFREVGKVTGCKCIENNLKQMW